MNSPWKFFLFILNIGIFHFSIPAPLPGQFNGENRNQKILEIIEDISATEEDTEAFDRISDILNELLYDPIDLNTATAEDLQQLFFLTEFQITSILNYRKEYGNYLSINELLLVPGIQPDHYNKLRFFVIASSSENEHIKNYNPGKIKSEMIVRYKRRFEIPAGFGNEIDSSRQFAGRNRYIMTRYELKKGNNLSAGFIAEQDPGEPLFSKHNKFKPDHISFFVEYSGKKKPYKIIAGDFRTGFGQGLINGNSYISKSANAVISPEMNKIRRNLSTSESGYHRGLAFHTHAGNLSLSSYFSCINHDAVIRTAFSESDSFQYFTSVNRTGLHRNSLEIKNRSTLQQFTGGADLTFRFKFFSLGIHGEKVSFSHPMLTQEYNPGVYPPGFTSDFFNYSVHYKASVSRIYFFGEWASDKKGHTAILKGLTAQLHPLVSLSMIYRNYSPSYISFSSSAFGKTSSVKNEEGLYVGINIYPLPFVNISCYADHYRFPHPKLALSVPSIGNDYLVNTVFLAENENQFTIRYKASHQQMKIPRNGTGVDLNDLNRISSWRFIYRSGISESLFVETRYELTINDEHQIKPTKGYYAGQKINYKPTKHGFNVFVSYGLFDAPDWKNRIYLYEHDLLYAFSLPVLYRTGSRFSVLFRTSICKRTDLWVKYYLTHYSKSIETGTGADKIINSSDSGVKIQLRMKM